MFRHPFSFKGRIRRIEYALSHLIYLGCIVLIDFSGNFPASSIISWAVFIPAFWFVIAQTAKRCHDRGMSGWFQLVPVYQLILLFADGQPGENEYGPDPRKHAFLK